MASRMHGEVQIRFWEGLRKPASATGEQPIKKSLTGEFVRAAALSTLIIFSDMRLRIVRAQGAPGFRGCGALRAVLAPSALRFARAFGTVKMDIIITQR